MTRPWRIKLALVGSACAWLPALALAAQGTQIVSPVAGKNLTALYATHAAASKSPLLLPFESLIVEDFPCVPGVDLSFRTTRLSFT